MPIYEYQCQECGHKLEKLQKVTDDPLKDCPACNRPCLDKLVSAVAFRLKGGGWYETDFKTGNKKNVSGGDSGSPDSAGADSAGSPSKDGSPSSGDSPSNSGSSSGDSSSAAATG